MKKRHNFNVTFIGLAVIIILLIAGIIFAFENSKDQPITQYTADDNNSPRLEIGQIKFDFGIVKVSDTRTQEVPIKNMGQNTLVLSDFISSCDCTSAEVIIGDKISPRFSMHRTPDWRGEIVPNTSAIIRLIYDPKVMPVKGPVKRAVLFKTNDPKQPEITLSFNAIVE